MTTATQTPRVPDQTTSPVEPSLSAMLYSSDVPVETAPPAEVTPPETTLETDPSLETATPPVDSKTEEPPAGTEDKEDAVKKQLADQTKANKRLGKELAELREEQRRQAEENKILLAKLKGEYEEPPQPTIEQVRAEEKFKERERLSYKKAVEVFGQETMDTRAFGNGSELETIILEEKKTNPGRVSATQVAILLSEEPAMEAMRILQTRDFAAQYGEDPTKWAEKVIADAKPKILEELKKQLTTPVTGGQPPTVSNGRGAGSPPKEKSLADILFDKS